MKYKTTPTYFQWVFTDHYFKSKQGVLKLIATIFSFIMAFYMPGPILEEYWSGWMPIWPVIGAFIAVYGSLIGILLQPYLIYRRLKRLNWWNTIDNDLKQVCF